MRCLNAISLVATFSICSLAMADNFSNINFLLNSKEVFKGQVVKVNNINLISQNIQLRKPFASEAELVLKMAVGQLPKDMRYDLNGDGLITSADALAVRQLSSGIQPKVNVNQDSFFRTGKIATPEEAKLALQMSAKLIPLDLNYDLNNSGTVTSADALAIHKIAANGDSTSPFWVKPNQSYTDSFTYSVTSGKCIYKATVNEIQNEVNQVFTVVREIDLNSIKVVCQ